MTHVANTSARFSSKASLQSLSGVYSSGANFVRSTSRDVERRGSVATVALLVACAALCGCPTRDVPSAQGGADYFRFSDGYDPVYARSTGQEEEHDYVTESDPPEGALRFQRLASAGGFVESDRTMQFEVTEEELRIVSFLDCLNDCERLASPQKILPWPLDGSETITFDVDVTVIQNSEEVRTQPESHRIAIGNIEDISVPAGDFSGYDVLWTRTIDGGASRTARLFVVPDVGFVKVEGWDGATMELKSAPPALEE